MAESIREYGHLAADLYPLKNRQLDTSRIEESVFNLTAADLQAIPASVFLQMFLQVLQTVRKRLIT